MARLVLDAFSHIARLSGVPELQQEVEQAVEQALQEDPGLHLCSSQIVYREFLRHLVTPFLVVRDTLIERLYNRKFLSATWLQIEEALADLKARPLAGGHKALPMVLRTLRRRYPQEPVPIRQAFRFLDSTARDLAHRHFFRLQVKGEEVELARTSGGFLNAADCLSETALQSRETTGSRCLCQLSSEPKLCPRTWPSTTRTDRCFDAAESPLRCCSRNPDEVCRIEAFLSEEAVLVTRLAEHAKTKGFSRRLQEKSGPLLVACEAMCQSEGGDLAAYKNERCADQFSEVLILLECGAQARLVSYDETYDELAGALGWEAFRIAPGRSAASALPRPSLPGPAPGPDDAGGPPQPSGRTG
jgi:hypothetical protein